jgi:hypothetical protein
VVWVEVEVEVEVEVGVGFGTTKAFGLRDSVSVKLIRGSLA